MAYSIKTYDEHDTVVFTDEFKIPSLAMACFIEQTRRHPIGHYVTFKNTESGTFIKEGCKQTQDL